MGDDRKIKVYTVHKPDSSTVKHHTYSDLVTLIDKEFTHAAIGERFTITIGEMTEEEYENLP
jgi:hypothetical protein